MSDKAKITDDLVERIAMEISRRYRIVPDAAKRVLRKHFADKKLKSRLRTISDEEDVERLHEFKEAVKDAKKEIYYNLRRYHRDKEAENDLIDELKRRIESKRPLEDIDHVRDELLLMHSSTAERFEHYNAFYEELYKVISPPKSILDVACGLHPLSYPFNKNPPEIYACIDRDELCIRCIEAYAQSSEVCGLRGIVSDLGTIQWQSMASQDSGPFELAFMLKLVPVIDRQKEDLLKKLADVPATRILLTGNAESLTRRHDVSRREDRALKSFIELSGRRIISEFRIPNEFGYLIE